jgi:hypothetical protein
MSTNINYGAGTIAYNLKHKDTPREFRWRELHEHGGDVDVIEAWRFA